MTGSVWQFNRNAQCPERGPGLTHIQDYREHPDGRCIYCGEGKRKTQLVCSGTYCTNSVWVDKETVVIEDGLLKTKVYCPNCERIRGQTKFSHETEGHSHRAILMCPLCEGGK